MAYVPGFKWDIFISYAHRDREIVPEGWIRRLRTTLESKVDDGLNGRLEIFYDETSARGNMTVSEIDSEVKSSAVLVLFASPNWIRSSNCQNELNAMLSEPNGHRRIFVIETKPPAGELQYPQIVDQLIRIEIYKRVSDVGAPIVLDSNEDLFHVRLFKIGEDIRNELIQMRDGTGFRSGGSVSGTAPIKLPRKGSVLFGSCAEEVLKARRDLVDYLTPKGHSIEKIESQEVDNRDAFRRSLVAKLKHATVFVQLLGPEASLCNGSKDSLNQIEFELARKAGADIVQWRPNWLNPHEIQDEMHRQLVQSAQNGTVVPELVQRILDVIDKRLSEPHKQAAQGTEPHYVLVSSAPEDSDRAGELVDALSELDVLACNDNSFAPENARAVWASCQVIGYLQAKSDPSTIFLRSQAINKERAASGVDSALLGQAAIYGPPSGKASVIAGRKIVQIDLSDDWNPARFAEWVRSILPGRST